MSLIIKQLLKLSDEDFKVIYDSAIKRRNELRDHPFDSDGDERYTQDDKEIIKAEFALAYQAQKNRLTEEKYPGASDMFI